EGEAQKIDIHTILKIAQFFNVDIKELIQVHISSASAEEISILEKARKYGYLIKNFDLKLLRKIGFISDEKDVDSIEKRIKDFFNLNSLYEYSTVNINTVFSRTKND